MTSRSVVARASSTCSAPCRRLPCTGSCSALKATEKTRPARGPRLFAGERLTSVELHSFRDGFFPDSFGEIKERFRDIQRAVDPDLVFTSWRRDAHQDHRLISELTSQTFRNHLILEYEISKYDGDLGAPNVYVSLDVEEADRKVEHLMSAFASQHDKYWFSGETFRALMRVRGVECRASSGYAEAFYGHKLVFGAGSST